MMDILFVTDFVCPYCLVAKAALEEALKETGIPAHIRIQPMELTPEPKERIDVYHDQKRRARYQVLVEPARSLGLDMKLPPAVCPRPYTRLAFEGLFYAMDRGREESYSHKVYLAYFEKEQDIGDLDVLCAIAQEAGLDIKEFRSVLEAGTYTEKVREASDYSRNVLQVTGIPAIYLDSRRISPETYTKEEMVRLLLEGQEEPLAGMCCGIDGCG